MKTDFEWTALLDDERKTAERHALYREWAAGLKSGEQPVSAESQAHAAYYGFSESTDEGELCREWFSAAEKVLHYFAMATAKGGSLHPLPCELLLRMSNICGYFAGGTLPGVANLATRKGRPSAGPDERRDIGYAVAYHRAATVGITLEGKAVAVDDPSPTSTLATWFNVDRRTVQKWAANSALQPFLGIGPVTAEIIQNQAKRAGERYSQAGRSKNAIHARDAKRART